MEEIIAWEIARWIPSIISFIFSNLLTIFLIFMFMMVLAVVAVMAVKRRMTKRVMKEAQAALKDAAYRIDAIMTGEYFRDLELGLTHGSTEKKLTVLQQDGFAMRQEAERLQQRSTQIAIPLFSLLGPYIEVRRFREEVFSLARRVGGYDQELQRVKQAGEQTRSMMRKVEDRYHEIAQYIADIRSETGYSLEQLQQSLKEAERRLKDVAQSTAFDALQARSEIEALERTLHALRTKAASLMKNISTLLEMKNRLAEQGERILDQSADGDGGQRAREPDTAQVLAEAEAILAELEQHLGRGEDVDLRQAAVRIEDKMKKAAGLG